MQHMSAGRGIRHSEFNPSATEPVHLYQIWLLPRTAGLAPSYSQKSFSVDSRQGRWQLVASPDSADGSLKIEQDARIFLGNFTAPQSIEYSIAPERHAWLQVLRGTADVDSTTLLAGDGLAISNESQLKLRTSANAELMLFDLA